jgi:hypothetical protein
MIFKTKPWIILMGFVVIIGLLIIFANNYDETLKVIETPPVPDAQLERITEKRLVVRDAMIDSLTHQLQSLKAELAELKEVNNLQSKRTAELATSIGTLRTELETVKTQKEAVKKQEMKINPAATHPMVSAEQNKKPMPGGLDAEIAKNLGKGSNAGTLTPDEQRKLSKLKKNELIKRLQDKKAKATTPKPSGGLIKKLKTAPQKTDSVDIKRPGKWGYIKLQFASYSWVHANPTETPQILGLYHHLQSKPRMLKKVMRPIKLRNNASQIHSVRYSP